MKSLQLGFILFSFPFLVSSDPSNAHPKSFFSLVFLSHPLLYVLWTIYEPHTASLTSSQGNAKRAYEPAESPRRCWHRRRSGRCCRSSIPSPLHRQDRRALSTKRRPT